MAENSDNPIPFSEPPYLRGLPSPYYSQSHIDFQKRCRAWIHENFTQHAMDWEKAREVPAHVFDDFNKANMLLPNMPAPLPVEWCKKLGIHDIQGVKVEDWDYMHTGIYLDEMSRCAIGGPGGSLNAGFAFGIPPLIKYGSRELQERFLPELLTGKKRTCIAVTEPGAGSDVANVATTAVKTPDGKHYIINGAKKWITNGIWSDYATMAVRTGGPGAKGLSVVVVPLKNTPGVSMRRIEVSGLKTSGTTYIDLEDVKIPVSNLVGKEGNGMKMIMANFNHERLLIAVGANRTARAALASAVAYTMKRDAFGKKLMDQPVVRHRIAKAGADVEMLTAWLEQMLYQLSNMPRAEADIQLGGLTALAKAKSAMVLNDVSQCAVLLFGGNGLTMSGQGELVEAVYRDVMALRIPGGSEDVLLDLSVRQLVKVWEATEKFKGASKL